MNRSSERAKQELAEVRRVLLGPYQDRLEDFERKLDDQTALERLSASLPAAVRRASEMNDALGGALATPIERGVAASVKRNPQPLVDAVTPIIVPAIRRVVSQQIARIVHSIDQLVDQSLTVRGIRWRLEARRTGRTVAEVALKHSLRFRVEQAFLIHGPTGILLRHVSDPSIEANAPDLVSGMLTALEAFVGDSFQSEELLDSINVGELKVTVERSGSLLLACVVRGVLPPDLRSLMCEVLDAIQAGYWRDLVEFDGDVAPFVGTDVSLSRCLVSELKEERRRRSFARWIVAGLLLLAVLVWLLLRPPDTVEPYLDRLERTPGVVVLGSEEVDGAMEVRLLRDPLAVVPQAPEGIRLRARSYRSLDPPIVERRAGAILGEELDAHLDDGTLRLTGEADRSTLHRIDAFDPGLLDVARIDRSAVVDRDRTSILAAAAALESASVLFDARSATADLRRARELLTALDRVLGAAGARAEVTFTGRADATGEAKDNLRLSAARASFAGRAADGLERIRAKTLALGSRNPIGKPIGKQRAQRPPRDHGAKRANSGARALSERDPLDPLIGKQRGERPPRDHGGRAKRAESGAKAHRKSVEQDPLIGKQRALDRSVTFRVQLIDPEHR